MIDQGTTWEPNHPVVVYIKCKNCNWESPIDTNYVYKACDCYGPGAFIEDRSEVIYKNKAGEDVYRHIYTGPSYIAVDGGEDYCRYIGDPDNFVFLDSNREEIIE